MDINRVFHNVIKTQYVFTKNNQVFIRPKEPTHSAEWHPINFQWIPALEFSDQLNQLPFR